ncbi:folate-binding protein YgfZ [Seiridium cupressi]
MKAFLPLAFPIRAVASRRARASFSCNSTLTERRTVTTRAPGRGNPGPPPTIGYAPLPNRKLIAIAGVDAPKFLQGLITASIYKPGAPSPEEVRSEGFYTAFLTAQGRVLHDVFIHPNPQFHGITDVQSKGVLPEQSFLLEVGDSHVEALFALIRRYKLRSSFVHRKVEQEDCFVYSYWNESFSDPTGVPEHLSKYGKGAYITRDSRAPDLGWRVITNNKRELKVDAEKCPRRVYTVRRFLRGVAEGPGEIIPDKTLPLDANIDLMGGIDFRKGCYVGQELTIRTKHRGVVRKRILPCMVYGEDEPMPQELVYRATPENELGAASVPSKTDIVMVGSTRKRQTGNWIGGIGNVGLAMCRLQPMTNIELPGESADAPFDTSSEFMFKWEGREGKHLKVKPFVPDWMRQKLAQNTSHSQPTQPQ